MRWPLKSLVPRVFTQLFVQAQIKENIKEFTEDLWFSAQWDSDVENVSIFNLWCYHGCLMWVLWEKWQREVESLLYQCSVPLSLPHTSYDFMSLFVLLYCNLMENGSIMKDKCILGLSHWDINSSPPGQNGRHFAYDIFRCIFLNENICILIEISLKFVPMGPIDNKATLVLIMAWHQIGGKPLSESMLTQFTDTYMRH